MAWLLSNGTAHFKLWSPVMINKITVPYPHHAETGNQEITHQSNGMYTANLHKSIDMPNKNTPGVKKARPSRMHQLALIHTLN